MKLAVLIFSMSHPGKLREGQNECKALVKFEPALEEALEWKINKDASK